MKSYYIILIFFLFSCGNSLKRTKQEVDHDNDSIVFKKIENSHDYRSFSKFILENPKSKYFKKALTMYHVKWVSYYDSIDMPILDCFQNCANIHIKANQEIAFEGQLIKHESLYDSLLVFLVNKDNAENRPEKKIVEDVYGNIHEISKGHIQLEYIIDSCEIIQDVAYDIKRALDSYKEYLSEDWYSQKLEKLSLTEKNQIDSLLQYRLMLYGWDKEYVVPPPPPGDLILNE